MKADRKLVPITGDELRALLRLREELLVAEERAAVEMALASAEADVARELCRGLGGQLAHQTQQ